MQTPLSAVTRVMRPRFTILHLLGAVAAVALIAGRFIDTSGGPGGVEYVGPIMSLWGAVIGGAVSLAGGLLAGQGAQSAAESQNQAGRDSLNLFKTQTGQAKNLYGSFMFGPENYRNMIGASGASVQDRQTVSNAGDGDVLAQDWRGPSGLVKAGTPIDQIPGVKIGPNGEMLASNGTIITNPPELVAPGSSARNFVDNTGSVGDNIGDIGSSMSSMGIGQGGIIGELGNIAQSGIEQGQQNLTDWDAATQSLYNMDQSNINQSRMETGRLDRMAEGGQTMAANYGMRRQGEIEQDRSRMVQEMNDASAAQFAGMGAGMGGSLGANAQRGNQLEAGRLANRAITDVQGQATQLGLGALNQRLGVGQNRQAALEQMYAQQTGRSERRGLGRSAMQESNLGRELALRAVPLDAMQTALQSGTMNPFLGHNTSQYFPGASGGGSFASTAGNALGAVGGQLLGAGIQDYYNQKNKTT